MRTIPREVGRSGIRFDPVETTRRRLSKTTKSELEMYILGALHDATFNRIHKTFRFSQSSTEWLELIKEILTRLSSKSWIYREGKQRNVWILETSAKFIKRNAENDAEKIAYIRGYFDSEGGMPKNDRHFLYFQFCQKNQSDLEEVRKYLIDIGIKCGIVHNPSKQVDDNYWRFFLSRTSHKDFMNKVNSWHPRKAKQMELRMKI